MIINHSGVTIRMPIEDIRVMGRKTQGVKLINQIEGDIIEDVVVIENEEGGRAESNGNEGIARSEEE